MGQKGQSNCVKEFSKKGPIDCCGQVGPSDPVRDCQGAVAVTIWDNMTKKIEVNLAFKTFLYVDDEVDVQAAVQPMWDILMKACRYGQR